MISFAPNTILRLSDTFQARLDSSNEIHFRQPIHGFSTGPHTLALLHAFTQPRSMQSALELLRPRMAGMQDWMSVTSTLQELYTLGIIQVATDEHARFISPIEQAGPSIRTALLYPMQARSLVERLLACIRAAVRPGEVVVDYGTCTGIVARAAAEAGAARVYAVSSSHYQSVAAAIIAASPAAERITLLCETNAPVQIPESAHVLTSELLLYHLGSAPFVRMLSAARQQYAPYGRVLPNTLQVLGTPVVVPEQVVAQHTFTPATVDTWRAWYGIHFDPCVEVATRTPYNLNLIPARAAEWSTLAPCVQLAQYDLSTDLTSEYRQVTSRIAADGMLNGVVLHHTYIFDDTNQLELQPGAHTYHNLYDCPAWLMEQAIEVHTNDQVALTYAEPGLRSAYTLTVNTF